MPNIGFSELLIILVIALVVFGPRKLPEIGRTIGKSLREFRRASDEIRSELRFDLDDDEDPPFAAPARPPKEQAALGESAPPAQREAWTGTADSGSSGPPPNGSGPAGNG